MNGVGESTPLFGTYSSCPPTTMRWLLFGLFLAGSMTRNLMRPFLPLEAVRLSINETALGTLFAVTPLCTALASPAVGWLCGRIGSFPVLMGALSFLAVVNLATGLVPTGYLPPAVMFTILLILRAGMGAGLAGISTGTIIGLAHCYPEEVGLNHGRMEMCDGLASAAGNTAGGFLFSFGGWRMPCMALGATQLFTVMAILPLWRWVFREEQQAMSELSTDPPSPLTPGLPLPKPVPVWRLLLSPGYVFPTIAMFLVALAFSIPDPIMPLYWTGHGMSVQTVGIVQAIGSLSYAASCLYWGTVSQKVNPHILLSGGLLTCGLACAFLPSPHLLISGVMYVTLSVTGACILVPTVPALLPVVQDGGPVAMGLALGVVEGCYFIGEVLGPVLGEWTQVSIGVPATFALLGHLLFTFGILHSLWFFCS